MAHGVTRIALRNNFALLFVFIPALIFAVSRFGGVGAAACAAVLNIVAMALSAVLTFPRYLPGAGRRWLLTDLARPLLTVFAAAFVLSRIVPAASSLIAEALLLATSGLAVLAIGALTDPQIRAIMLSRFAPAVAKSPFAK